MPRNVAWGIDIGDSAIKAVRLRRVGDSVVIQDYRTIPCEALPEETHAGDKEYRVRSALATLQREVKFRRTTVVVSMSGRDVFPRFIPLPPVEKKRIPEIVRYEARTQMPFPIEEVIWDYQPITGGTGPGEEVEVGIFAIKKATVYGFLTNLRLAHFMPDIVEIAPLALYNFLMYDRSIEAGTVVIDIGSGTTDLVIIDGERFWTRNVSISGADITRALQEKYQISYEEAENLKRKAAESKQADKLFGTMRPILDDLIGEIQRSIGYYKAQTRNVRIENIILLGNAFKLKGLADYFRSNLDYEVTLLQDLRRIKVAAGGEAGRFEPELPNYAVAIGLALQGLGVAPVNIDMMPRDVVRERVLRQKVPYAAAIVGLIALPVLLGFRSAGNDLSRSRGAIAQLDPQIAQERKKLDEIKAAENLEPMSSQLKEMARIGAGRNEWVRFFNSLNLALIAINKNQRGDFIFRSAKEEVAEGTRRTAAVVAPAAKGKAKGKEKEEQAGTAATGLRVQLIFERASEPSKQDMTRLQTALEEQPGISRVTLLDVYNEATRGVPKDGAAAIGGGNNTFVTVGVTFNAEPERGEE